MRKIALTAILIAGITSMAFKPLTGKLVSNDGHISFYSHTAVEDITANNYKVVSTLESATGDLVFSVPMQSFEFEKALMQQHFNSKDFLDTKKYPKAKFTGKITNIGDVDFGADGSYDVTVSGELTIKEATKPLEVVAVIHVAGNKITLDSKIHVVLADYGVTFTKGKPSTNIAKEVEITVKTIYQGQ